MPLVIPPETPPDNPDPMADPMADARHPLRIWREWRGLSLTDVAKLSGITKPTLSRLENGRFDPSSTVIRQIAIATGGAVTADAMIWWRREALRPIARRRPPRPRNTVSCASA